MTVSIKKQAPTGPLLDLYAGGRPTRPAEDPPRPPDKPSKPIDDPPKPPNHPPDPIDDPPGRPERPPVPKWV